MATSDVEICNSAISKVGAARIIALSDDSEEARLCKTLYPILRDKLLRSHPWRFATKRVQLALSVDAPLFDFSAAFKIPNDSLRILNTDQPDDRWKEESGFILADNSTLMVQYIWRNLDVSTYDANFCEVLAYQLAMEIVFPLTQNASLRTGLEASMEKELRTARSFNAQIGSVESVQNDSWITVRS